jgi:hypothetical protein
MATVEMDTMSDCTQQIGETAGQVWHALNENGPLTLAKLTKLVEAPRDTVMQAVGWLAREDKIEMEDRPRGRVITLKA